MKFPRKKTVEVTLQIDVQWSKFLLSASPPKRVQLSRSFHPKFKEAGFGPVPSLEGLQKAFDAGSELLGKDNDAIVPDDDPWVTPDRNQQYPEGSGTIPNPGDETGAVMNKNALGSEINRAERDLMNSY